MRNPQFPVKGKGMGNGDAPRRDRSRDRTDHFPQTESDLGHFVEKRAGVTMEAFKRQHPQALVDEPRDNDIRDSLSCFFFVPRSDKMREYIVDTIGDTEWMKWNTEKQFAIVTNHTRAAEFHIQYDEGQELVCKKVKDDQGRELGLRDLKREGFASIVSVSGTKLEGKLSDIFRCNRTTQGTKQMINPDNEGNLLLWTHFHELKVPKPYGTDYFVITAPQPDGLEQRIKDAGYMFLTSAS
jgi:hypothetical protein